jgi:hypothetical protein
MTLKELLAIPPENINSLTDAQLEELLTPFFPQVRAAYAGKKQSKIITAPGRYRSRKDFDDKLAQLLAYTKANK